MCTILRIWPCIDPTFNVSLVLSSDFFETHLVLIEEIIDNEQRDDSAALWGHLRLVFTRIYEPLFDAALAVGDRALGTLVRELFLDFRNLVYFET